MQIMSIRSWILVVSLLVITACTPNTTATEIPAPNTTNTVPQATDTIAPEIPASEEPTAMPTETTLPVSPPNSEADADVTFVRAAQSSDGSWTFHVTVAHPDTGWEDYADGWDVVLPDGTVLKPDPGSPYTRLLLHPHENEQPFTRSQSNIVIPDGITLITVRAHDLVHGFGGQEVVVDLSLDSGENFEVQK